MAKLSLSDKKKKKNNKHFEFVSLYYSNNGEITIIRKKNVTLLFTKR